MSKIQYTIILLVLVFACRIRAQVNDDPSNDWEDNPLVLQSSNEEVDQLTEIREMVLEKGCQSNVCFVLDGGDSVTQEFFEMERNFVQLIISIIATDEPGNYCAVQYNDMFSPISSLTNDRLGFLRAVRASTKIGGGSNLIPGVRYAVDQLSGRDRDSNKIISFSQNRPVIDRTGPALLRRFSEAGGALCAVTSERSDVRLLKKLTRDANRVVTIDDFFDLSEVIIAIVKEVCNM